MSDAEETLERIRAIVARTGNRAECAKQLAETVRNLGNYRLDRRLRRGQRAGVYRCLQECHWWNSRRQQRARSASVSYISRHEGPDGCSYSRESNRPRRRCANRSAIFNRFRGHTFGNDRASSRSTSRDRDRNNRRRKRARKRVFPPRSETARGMRPLRVAAVGGDLASRRNAGNGCATIRNEGF